jgi:hypothetical protein
MLPPFFGGSRCQPRCTHPSSEAASLGSVAAFYEILGSWSWTKPLNHGLNDNFIGHCRRLCSKTQEPSDICLEVLLMILRALKQGLSCDWLRLEALETCHQHILELLP